MPRQLELGLPTLILLSSLWLSSVVNAPFWRVAWEGSGGARPDNVLFLASLAVCVVAWTFVLLSVFAWGRAARPVLVTVLLVSAAASYFIEAYGVLIDRDMVTNVAQTDWAEARDLLTWRLGAWLLVLGVLPALAMTRVRIARRTWMRELALKAVTVVAAGACFAGLVLVNYQHFASLARNHRELRYLLVPQNIASALHSHVKRAFAVPLVLEAVGTDASRAAPVVATGKPLLLVLAIGETARAANFSLNGYARATNPELARRDVLSYTDVTACGTSTAVSLPCMFLDAGRAGFDDTLVRRREGLLDVLQHAGIAVRWLDNNAGCKGVCDRVAHEDLSRQPDSTACPGGECLDQVLLERLRAGLDRLDRDTVVVLHLMGSHGPAYYKRYPAEFGVFAPTCDTVQLDRCSRESIVNAYDNSLRYTDHILAATIDLLQAHAGRYDTAMLYVSDHGESLGEKGLYLHGVPYALAPREQLRVPMVLWLSAGLSERLGVDVACLRSHRDEPISHDNLYHSVLGLSAVRAGVYRPERDLLHRCRT